MQQAPLGAEAEIPPEKRQGAGKEVTFLGTWWIAGSTTIPLGTLSKIEQLQIPQSRKELQPLAGTSSKKNAPGFSIAFMKGKTTEMGPRT